MREIREYELPLDHEQQINMPEGGKILTARGQPTDFNQIVLYAEVDPNSGVTQLRTIRMIETDEIFDADGLRWIATVQAGEFTWHLYEQTDENPGGVQINPL
jgi:hypothetical protein